MDSGVADDVESVAHLIAIEKIAHELGTQKIITFHKTVSAAEKFAALSEKIEGFKSIHINGKIPASKRDQLLQEFRDAKSRAYA